MDVLNFIFNGQTFISALIGGVTGAAALYGILRFIYRKEIRLFNNAKRPIMIFKCDGMNMEIETQMLRDIGFFNVNEQPCSNFQMADRITDHGLVIVAYAEGNHHFDEILSRVRTAKVPLIVYSKTRIPDDVTEKIRGYSWCLLCQYPLRLVNDVFGILYTFPHG